MPNTATLTRNQLEFLDEKIYSPDEIQLMGRKLFNSISVPAYMNAYRYRVVTTSGKAKLTSTRATSSNVGDETMLEYTSPIYKFSYDVVVDEEDLATHQAAKDTDFLQRKADRATRAIAEFEDRLFFNGLGPDKGGPSAFGLTSKASDVGFQEIKPTKTLDKMDPGEIVDMFEQAYYNIKELPGNDKSVIRPSLLISPKMERLLDVHMNEYNIDKYIPDVLSKWFSSIEVVPELAASATGRKNDMAIVGLTNDRTTAGIPDAMKLNNVNYGSIKGVQTIRYREQCGSLVFYKPDNFVQIPDLLTAK